MAGLERITPQTLDILQVLLQAHREDAPLHGWAIMKATGRAGPTVYRVLDRLEEACWVTGEWEEQAPDATGPRRRLYRLTGEGAPGARTLLAERRPGRVKPFTVPGLGWISVPPTGGAR